MIECWQLMNGMAAARMQEGVTNYPENDAFVCARGTKKRRAALWWRRPLICRLVAGVSALLTGVRSLGDASGRDNAGEQVFDVFNFINVFRQVAGKRLPFFFREGEVDGNAAGCILGRDNFFDCCVLGVGDGTAFGPEPTLHRAFANVQFFGQFGARGATLDEPLL